MEGPEGKGQPLAALLRVLHVLALLPRGVLGVYRRGGSAVHIVGQHLGHGVSAEDQIIAAAFQNPLGMGPVPDEGEGFRHLGGQGRLVQRVVLKLVVDLHVLRLPALYHELPVGAGVDEGHVRPLRGHDPAADAVDEQLRGVDESVVMGVGGEEGAGQLPGALRQGRLGQLSGFLHQGSLHRVSQIVVGVGGKLGGVVRALQLLVQLAVVHGGEDGNGGRAPGGLAAVPGFHVPEYRHIVFAHVLDAPGVQLLFHKEELRSLIHPLVDAPQADAAAFQRALDSLNHIQRLLNPDGCGPSYRARRQKP